MEVAPLVMRAIRAEMRCHRTSDLSIPQFRTLTFLNHHEGASLSAVAGHIGLTLPSMSKTIDGLVARNLIKRETHPDDRRRVTLALTARGRSAWQVARDDTRTALAEKLAALSPQDRSIILQAMQALRAVFESDSRCE
jgi:DNA-binding MarR family transcriptional regulator